MLAGIRAVIEVDLVEGPCTTQNTLHVPYSLGCLSSSRLLKRRRADGRGWQARCRPMDVCPPMSNWTEGLPANY